MSHQSDKMKASITSYGFYKEEEEKKKETDKELSDNSDDNNKYLYYLRCHSTLESTYSQQ